MSASTDRIVVVTGGRVQDYDLRAMGKRRINIGRSSEQCEIVVPSSRMSSVHLRVKYDDFGTLHVADVGSTNGTCRFVNNTYVRIPPKKYIRMLETDMILRVDSQAKDAAAGVLIVITNSSGIGGWVHAQLAAGSTTLGRGAENDIVIDSPAFSRKHAVLTRRGEDISVRDCGSMNGVYVNGRRVAAETSLREKDVLQIAGSLFILTGTSLLYQKELNGISLLMDNVSKVVGSGAKEKAILQHVSCRIGSNEFVAVIGGSGAGKTTVMTAMSGFDPDVFGRVLLNGIDLHRNFDSLKNRIGFVPQQDIIYENLTLRDMLEYTAKLKMPPDTSKTERNRRISLVLQMVDLSEHAETYIRKLSGGQKKRASIAVELLADPGLFFLDEPTSGLDPDTEQSLMHTLARLSKNEGKTIVMVTHTTQSIHLCDKIIVMGPGGKICYCGPPAELTGYFGKRELVEVYSELARDVDRWNSYYMQNYLRQAGQGSSRESSQGGGPGGRYPGDHVRAAVLPGQNRGRRVSPARQLFVLIARYAKLIVNDAQRLVLLFVQPVLIALLLLVVANEHIFVTYEDTQSMMFALACSGIWIGMFNTIQEVCKERAILKREYMGGLSLISYILSKCSVQSVICLIQTGILTGTFLSLAENEAGDGLFCANTNMEIALSVYLTIFASSAMGLIISSLVRNADRAMAVSPFVLIIQLLFSGAIFALPEGAGEWFSKLTVSRFAMECLGNITNLNALPRRMAYEDEALAAVIPAHYDDLYARSSEHLWHIWAVLVLIAAVCGGISVFVLRSLKKDNR